MFILSNFLGALAQGLNVLITIYWWMIIIRAVVSWVNPDPRSPFMQILQRLTEPFLSAIRRRLPYKVGYALGFDISPLIAIFILMLLRGFLVKTLIDLSEKISQT